MKLLSEGEVFYLTLAIIEAELTHLPSFRFQVEVSDRGFTASSSVWAAADDVHIFASQLRQCQRMGRSQALLSSMSPGELELRVEPSDALGHFQVVYRVGRHRLNNAGRQAAAVTGGFDLDPYLLEQMVEGAELLAL